MPVLTLASASTIRAELLRRAGIDFDIRPARIDEDALRQALQAEGAGPRDVADALAEQKALRIAHRHPETLVLGCDQVLECDGALFSKPRSPEEARAQLARLRGRTHRLYSAAVLCQQGQPIWRHVSAPQLTMRDFSDAFLDDYVTHNWPEVRHCVGVYQIEGPGIRLFERVAGDHFAILGLPLLELLSVLTRRGDIPG
jgi:septum formation protein